MNLNQFRQKNLSRLNNLSKKNNEIASPEEQKNAVKELVLWLAGVGASAAIIYQIGVWFNLVDILSSIGIMGTFVVSLSVHKKATWAGFFTGIYALVLIFLSF